MSDLKPCPFCGSKSWEFRILDCEDREGTPCAYFCEACGAQSPWVYCRKSGEDINTMDDHKLIAMLCSRPIEDALRAEIANLKIECESWREGAERDMAEIVELSNGIMVASERAGRYAEEITALQAKVARYETALAMDTPYRDQASALSAARAELAAMRAKYEGQPEEVTP